MSNEDIHDKVPAGEMVDINDLLGGDSSQSAPGGKVKQADTTARPVPASSTSQTSQPSSTVTVTGVRCSSQQRALTDLGNAERLIDLYSDELRYSHAKERWCNWDGKRWAWAKSGELTRCAAEVTRSIAMESYLACNSNQTGKVLGHAKSSQNVARLKAMIEIAQDLKPSPVAVEELDADPWKFNCLNGTLNLKTGVLEPHSRSDLITKLAPVEYDPRASYTGWLRFLRRITGNDKDLIRYLRRMVGYALTGSCKEHALFILWGRGANGKSTMMVALQCVMGDYATQAPPDLLATRQNGSSNPFDVADLHGSRLVVDSEVAQNMKMDEAKAKRLTGGDRVKARHIYQDYFEFAPTHKLVIAANDKPRVHGDDDAIFRRLHLVPFTVQIPPDQQDKQLSDKLKLEASGILRWALGGCLEWARDGLQPPPCVRDATKEYRSEMDTVGTFIEEACKQGKGLEVRASELYEAYERWAQQSGLDPTTKTTFGKTVKKRGIQYKRGGKGHRVYLDIFPNDPGGADDNASHPSPPNSDGPKTSEDPMKWIPTNFDNRDLLSSYIHKYCYAGADIEVSVDELLLNYNKQAGEVGERRLNQDELKNALKARGWTLEDNVFLGTTNVRGIVFYPTKHQLASGGLVPLTDEWYDHCGRHADFSILIDGAEV